MSDLKHQLEALRLAEQEARPSRRRWLLAGAALVILAALLLAWRTVASGPAEVETIRASIQEVRPSGGSPMLTASGYVVARRKAVVSAKIQGRLGRPPGRGGHTRSRGRRHRQAREHRLRSAGRAVESPGDGGAIAGGLS